MSVKLQYWNYSGGRRSHVGQPCNAWRDFTDLLSYLTLLWLPAQLAPHCCGYGTQPSDVRCPWSAITASWRVSVRFRTAAMLQLQLSPRLAVISAARLKSVDLWSSLLEWPRQMTAETAAHMWLWLTMTDCDWPWLPVADSLTVTDCGWPWLTVTDCGWPWLTVADRDWLWLTVTGCGWPLLTDCDRDWLWLTVTVTDRDCLWLWLTAHRTQTVLAVAIWQYAHGCSLFPAVDSVLNFSERASSHMVT